MDAYYWQQILLNIVLLVSFYSSRVVVEALAQKMKGNDVVISSTTGGAIGLVMHDMVVRRCWCRNQYVRSPEKVCTAGSDCTAVGSDCNYSMAWAQTVQHGLRLLQSEPTLYSGLRWYGTNMKKYGRCGTKYHILPIMEYVSKGETAIRLI